MDYQGTIIRPPSEAFSLILQVTRGCTHNRCTFCGAYKGTRFTIKDDALLDQDLDFAAQWCKHHKKVFLADGDALALPHARFLALLEKIRVKLPWVRRISSYATWRNIKRKKLHELEAYRALGLQRLYMGVETGHNPTLRRIRKGTDRAGLIKAGQKVREAGIFLSVTCLLGIAGAEFSSQHGEDTAGLLHAMHPHQAALLSLMIIPDTPLELLMRQGLFQLPCQDLFLQELRTLVMGLHRRAQEDAAAGRPVKKYQFQANHASNYLNLSGRFPLNGQDFIDQIDRAIEQKSGLRPESQRAL